MFVRDRVNHFIERRAELKSCHLPMVEQSAILSDDLSQLDTVPAPDLLV